MLTISWLRGGKIFIQVGWATRSHVSQQSLYEPIWNRIGSPSFVRPQTCVIGNVPSDVGMGWDTMEWDVKRNRPKSDWTLGVDEVVSRVPRVGDAIAGPLPQGGRRGAERGRRGMSGPRSAGFERLHPGKK